MWCDGVVIGGLVGRVRRTVLDSLGGRRLTRLHGILSCAFHGVIIARGSTIGARDGGRVLMRGFVSTGGIRKYSPGSVTCCHDAVGGTLVGLNGRMVRVAASSLQRCLGACRDRDNTDGMAMSGVQQVLSDFFS